MPTTTARRFVYVLKNTGPAARYYTGVTTEVHARLEAHNRGACPHTARYRPWVLHLVIEFADEATALAFEKYLKSGSGRAFAKRHFS